MRDNLDLYIWQAYRQVSLGCRKSYSEASQDAILKILLEIFDVDICIRTLNSRLRKMEDDGVIVRTRVNGLGKYSRVKINQERMAEKYKSLIEGLTDASVS